MLASIIHFQYWTATICNLQVQCKVEMCNCCYVHAVAQSIQFKVAQSDCGMYLIKDAITLYQKSIFHTLQQSTVLTRMINLLIMVTYFTKYASTSLTGEPA